MAEGQRLPIRDWTPGLDLISGKAQGPIGQLWNVSNFHPYRHGLEPRRGIFLSGSNQLVASGIGPVVAGLTTGNPVVTTLTNPVIAKVITVGGMGNIRGLWVRRPIGGIVELMVVVDDNLTVMTYNGATWAPQDKGAIFGLSSSEQVSIAEFQGETILASSGLTMKKFTSSGTIATLSSEAPKAGAVASFEGFLFAGDLNPDVLTGEVLRSGFRWCTQRNAGQWNDTISATAGLKVVSQCPSNLQAIIPLSDELVILHESEIQTQRFAGAPEIFRTKVISTDVGSIGKRTYINFVNSVIFLGQNNLYIYSPETGITPLDSTRRIQDELFGLSIPTLQSGRFFFDHRNGDLWLFLNTSPPRAYVFHLHNVASQEGLLGSWTRMDFPTAANQYYPIDFFKIFPFDVQPFFLGSDGAIYRMSVDNTTDVGVTITATAETVEDWDSPEEKEFAGIEVIADGTGTVTVGVDGINNPNAVPSYVEKTLTLTTKPNENPVLWFNGIYGRYLALKLQTSDRIKIREVVAILGRGGVKRPP